ncbi:MAG: nitroreductase family protein, partial [Candidatus Nanohaloarchaea archaeon]
MSVFDQVRELPSFRRARDEVIERKKVGKILEAGRNAPSPGNVQSVEF